MFNEGVAQINLPRSPGAHRCSGKRRLDRKNSLEKPGLIIWGLQCGVSIVTLSSQQPKGYHSLFREKEPQRCVKSAGYFNTAFPCTELEITTTTKHSLQFLTLFSPLQSICRAQSSTQPRDLMAHPFKVPQLPQCPAAVSATFPLLQTL